MWRKIVGTPSETSSSALSRIHPLNQANLKLLRPEIAVPTYPRERLKRAIVHFGVGGFHRSHQAVYLDDLAEQRVTDQWGLCGVGLLPQDKRMELALLPQQCLYTVVARGVGAETARVVGSLTKYLFAPEHRDQVLGVLADPDTRLVTLTITEGGYNFNQVTGEFETSNPEIQADVRNRAEPSTVFGYICEALDRRRRAGVV